MANSLTVLMQDVKKLLGLLNQVDGFVKGGGVTGGGNMLSGSLAGISTVASGAGARIQTAGSLIGIAGTSLATAAGGVSSMMPDVALTIGRQAALYGAGVSSGGLMGTATLDRNTRLGLGQFQTSAGASSRVAAMLTGRGMAPTSAAFTRTVASTANAAKYLNMPNEVAASAFEGLTSGATSSMMMRNYGIYTGNPVTGQALGQKEIFEQLYQRFLGGRSTNVERTMESLRRGNLGANIRASGLDEAQQGLLSQYFIDRARGINVDYSDDKSVQAAVDRNKAEGIVNPMLDPMKLNSRQDELMSIATEPYLQGLKISTDALMNLSNVVEDQLIPSFGVLKSTLDNFMGNNMGAGAVTAAGAVLGGGLAGAGVLAGTGMFGGGGPKGGKTPKSSGKGNFKGGMGFRAGGPLGAAAMLGGQAMGGLGGDMLSGAGTGAMFGSFAGPKGMIIGAAIGALISGGASILGGSLAPKAPGKGGGGNIDPGPQGNNWTGAYGERRPYGIHDGVDIAMAVGTPLKAVMDGVVSYAGSGSGSRSRGLYITIEHENGYRTLYAHLSKFFVKKGDAVSKGQLVALSGNSGFSTGPHLHFSLYKNGTHINPGQFVNDGLYGGAGVSVPQGGYTASTGEQNINSGMTAGISTSNFASVINQFMSGGSSGISLGSSAMSILGSVLGGASGSFGSIASNSSGVNLPEPIGNTSSGMMGTDLNALLNSGESSGVGGGYEPQGLSEGTNLSSAISRSNSGSISSNGRSGVYKPQVTINVTIARASEGEAKRFAKMVKDELEEDRMLDRIGGK
jgi:hypothetical protein